MRAINGFNADKKQLIMHENPKELRVFLLPIRVHSSPPHADGLQDQCDMSTLGRGKFIYIIVINPNQ
ncbi:unnamed protein product, partial [Sphenostylis stenocarpa]